MDKLIDGAVRRAREDACFRGMTPRIKEHHERILRTMYERQVLWGGNLSILNDDNKKLSTTLRRTLAFEKVMKEMPINLEPYALLAGSCEKDGKIIRCMLPAFILEEERGKCTMSISHKCPDYETLLADGFSGILEKLESRKNELLSGAGNEDKINDNSTIQEKLDFYEAVRRECMAVILLSNRYADLAEQMGLDALAGVCRRVPEHGAETFHEAIQSIWFYNHCIRETMTRLSIGRIDHLLNPYFEKDYAAGKITLEQAQELVDAFCLRVNDRAQIDPSKYVVSQDELEGAPQNGYTIGYGEGFALGAENDQTDAINHWGQNILISGLRPDGSDDTNALTYMFLNAHEKFQLSCPVLTVRLHGKSPDELVERVAEVLKTGGGMPFINNDDVIVPAYEKLGVPREDACDYANSNCWETMIQGRSNQEMIRFVNFLHLLEISLRNGEPILPDSRRGIETGDASGFTSVGDIMDAWKKQLDYQLETEMDKNSAVLLADGSHGYYSSIPILSALTRDCVDRLTDVTHHGARYTLWHVLSEAVSNAADAFSAIQKFVYEDKLLTLEQLVMILDNNWDGEEALRMQFLKGTQRFGNNLETPDGFAREMVDYFVERVEFHAKKHDVCIYSPSIATFSWIISIGKRIGASADGRKHREPIAANMSPVPGADISGPVAAIQSYLKLHTAPMAAGAPIDLRLNKRGLDGPEGTNRIAALIKTFILSGGNMITLTVTDAAELRRAIADPVKYRNLRVRMGGWTAYFVLLSKEAQAIQLRRSEHGM